jgi:hypothetical protein
MYFGDTCQWAEGTVADEFKIRSGHRAYRQAGQMRSALDRCFTQHPAQSAVYQRATMRLNHPA